MQIQNAQLRFAALNQNRQQTEYQRAGQIQRTAQPGGNPVGVSLIYQRQENVRLESSQSAYLYSRSQISSAGQSTPVLVHSRESLLQSMVSHAFSRNVRIDATVALGREAPGARSGNGSSIATQASVAFGQAFRYQSEQQVSLTIEGRLNLADQRQIDFVLHTRMDSRLLFESGSGEYAGFAVRTDPLILNLQGGMAQLTDTAFDFDLDGDGSTESIAMATGGSGFIAFDRNGDGTINNGSELFGTRSGDGFAELAEYDDDGNGFIDEADAIYSQLKFWSRDENGNDRLLSLADAGIAAIGLEKANTPLQLRGQSGQELGLIRSTGIFVGQNGEVGSVQQVDLTRRDLDAEARFAADFDNAQFIPQAEGSSGGESERQQLDALMARLNTVREEYMARMDAMNAADNEDGKTLLEQLVAMLEQQIQELAEKRESSDAATPTGSAVKD